MTPAVKEWRHLLLMTAIIAALPLLIYPHSLGLGFHLGMVWYIVIELAYFFAMFRLLNPKSNNRSALMAVPAVFVGRLLMSAAFFLLLLVMGSVKPAVAITGAFGGYRPALILFSLTAPVVYNSLVNYLLPRLEAAPGTPRTRPRVTGRSMQREPLAPKQIPEQAAPEFFDHSFDAAVRHVGLYSGVTSALLIDSDGLPVAQFSRELTDVDMWAGLALKIIDQFEETLLKADVSGADRVEFVAGDRRFSMMRVEGMWLLVIAVAATDDLEKIRMQQAADMIAKHYHDKYSSLQISQTERSYARSTVGA
jgi:predicted regulator of Ras-like GTPase activity (Roadblock/LC7/MglB family)